MLGNVTAARNVTANFSVAGAQSAHSIPTLGPCGLVLLSRVLGLGGAWVRRRRG